MIACTTFICYNTIGANIFEAQYGSSKADFIAKLHIALKETAETEYWLHILKKSEKWRALWI